MRQLEFDASAAGLLEPRGIKDRCEPLAFGDLRGDAIGKEAAAHADDAMRLAHARRAACSFRLGRLFIPVPKIAYVKPSKDALSERLLDHAKDLIIGAASVPFDALVLAGRIMLIVPHKGGDGPIECALRGTHASRPCKHFSLQLMASGCGQ